ncbi:MAG TPA: hypothetical protein VL859_02455 [Flavobacterium sp.]|nr:hypothetical protein [Flavobacterium sp.]
MINSYISAVTGVGHKREATAHKILKTIHPQPTMSELVMEAVAAAYGEVNHI